MNTRETRLARSGLWAELGLLTKRIPNTREKKAETNPKRYKQIETDLNHDGGVGVDDLSLLLRQWGPCWGAQRSSAPSNHALGF